MGIHRKSGKKSGNLDPKSGRQKNLERLAGYPFQIFTKSQKVGLKKSGIAKSGIWNKLFC